MASTVNESASGRKGVTLTKEPDRLAYPTLSNISVQQKSNHTKQEYQPIKRNTQWQGVMKAWFTIPSFGF